MKTKPSLTLLRLNWALLVFGSFVPIINAGDGYPNNVSDGEDELPGGSTGPTALPTWFVSQPYINLWINTQPISYNTSWKKVIGFGVTYKQRNTRSSTNMFGLGPSWECSWLCYVQYKLNGTNATVDTTYVALGGERSYVPDGTSKEYKSDSTMTKL